MAQGKQRKVEPLYKRFAMGTFGSGRWRDDRLCFGGFCVCWEIIHATLRLPKPNFQPFGICILPSQIAHPSCMRA